METRETVRARYAGPTSSVKRLKSFHQLRDRCILKHDAVVTSIDDPVIILMSSSITDRGDHDELQSPVIAIKRPLLIIIMSSILTPL